MAVARALLDQPGAVAGGEWRAAGSTVTTAARRDPASRQRRQHILQHRQRQFPAGFGAAAPARRCFARSRSLTGTTAQIWSPVRCLQDSLGSGGAPSTVLPPKLVAIAERLHQRVGQATGMSRSGNLIGIRLVGDIEVEEVP